LRSTKGKKKLEVEIKGVKDKDWEDLCCFTVDGKSHLLIADVGDNQTKRKTVYLHIIREPDPKSISKKRVLQETVCTIPFTYPDGPRNCESVLVSGNDILLFSKGAAKKGDRSAKVSTVYHLPLTLKSPSKKLTATIIGKVKGMFIATAADASPSGNSIVVRDYARIFLFRKKPGETWAKRLARKPDTSRFAIQGRQNEAIGFGPDGTTLWTVSEGKNPDIWQNQTSPKQETP